MLNFAYTLPVIFSKGEVGICRTHQSKYIDNFLKGKKKKNPIYLSLYIYVYVYISLNAYIQRKKITYSRVSFQFMEGVKWVSWKVIELPAEAEPVDSSQDRDLLSPADQLKVDPLASMSAIDVEEIAI